MMTWQGQGKGSRAIARELNRLNITTPPCAWYAWHRKAVCRGSQHECHCFLPHRSRDGSRLPSGLRSTKAGPLAWTGRKRMINSELQADWESSYMGA